MKSIKQMVNEALTVNEASVKYDDKTVYHFNTSTQVEDAKVGNKWYNVKAGETCRLIDDNGEISTVQLMSGEIVNVESNLVVENQIDENYTNDDLRKAGIPLNYDERNGHIPDFSDEALLNEYKISLQHKPKFDPFPGEYRRALAIELSKRNIKH